MLYSINIGTLMLNICQTGTLPSSPDSVKMVLETAKAIILKKHSTEVALCFIIRPNIRSEVAVPVSRLIFLSLSSHLHSLWYITQPWRLILYQSSCHMLLMCLKSESRFIYFSVTEYYKLCCVGPVQD